jgi:hypothetical protein
MRANWLLVTLVAVLAVGCGEGRAIFNVDVYSFLKGTRADTVPYYVNPMSSGDSSSITKINLPGAGSSVVDQVHVTGSADFLNAIGAGKIALQLYLAEDSAGTYAPGALALKVDSTTITGAGTFPTTIDSDLTAALQVLTKSQVWVRVVGGGSNPNLTPLAGRLVVTSLLMHVVLTDKFF